MSVKSNSETGAFMLLHLANPYTLCYSILEYIFRVEDKTQLPFIMERSGCQTHLEIYASF